MKITDIKAREIFNSRGWPTIQCEVHLENEMVAISSVSSGISVSDYEAVELFDNTSRMYGKGVQKAIENIEQIIAPTLIGKEPNGIEMDLKIIELDGSDDKSRLGANATLAVSQAVYKAEALMEHVELYELIALLMDEETVSMPYPLFNIINGGAHASNNLSIQEFLIMPIGAPSFRAAYETGVLVYRELMELLKIKGKAPLFGREGGFSWGFKDDLEALDFLLAAIEKVNKVHTLSCVIGLDIAASQFYDSDKNIYKWQHKELTTDDMIALYKDLITQYPIYAIEDGLSQDDWVGWSRLTKELQNKVQIVGDDLFATNIERISTGLELEAATSVIIKPNQVGTVTEALQAIHVCKNYGLNTIVSHRSAETEDTFIADLAVGTSAGQIKAGSCCSAQGTTKYNRLLLIEDTLTMNILGN